MTHEELLAQAVGPALLERSRAALAETATLLMDMRAAKDFAAGTVKKCRAMNCEPPLQLKRIQRV
jgi:hypothetical protein